MGETKQDSYFESKENLQQQLQDIFQTTLRLTRPDQFDQLCQWMEYKQYLTINDFYDSSYNDPEKFDTKGPATEYKSKGKMNHLSPNVAQKLKCFVRWMTHEDRPYELHDDFLATLTRDNYLKFRHMDSQSFSASSPSHHEPYKLKTSFSGESKHQTPSKSTPAPQQVHQHSQDEPTEEPTPDTSTQTLVNKCLAESGIDPTDIQNVMSASYAKRNISSHESSRQIQTHQRYVFARVNQSNHHLIDRGANGGLAGADMRVIHTTPRKINIVGIDDHELTGLNVVTAAALLDTQKGPIIGVFHEYAHLGKGRSIHAAGQMEWFNCQVEDRSKLVGGAQRIKTSEGYLIPLSIESGLVYMHSMRIPTDHDLQNYPHVFFTSPDIWDTSVLDHGIPQSLLEDIDQHSDASLLQDSIFDAYGEPHHRDIQSLNSSFCDLPSLPPGEPITHAHMHDSNSAQEDRKSLSAVRSATKTSPNLRLDPPKGEDQPQDLTSDVFVYGRPNPDGSDNPPPMSIINFDDLLGRTFLLPMDENGERKRATISEHVKDLCQQQVSREDQLRFKLKIDGDQLDDLISYNQLMEYQEDKTDTGPLEDGLYRFKCIKDHKGPYTSSDPEYNGSSYNLLIEWETGEQTWEPLSNIIASDLYTCAVYTKEHNLLITPGWKPLKRHARTARRLIRTLKKSKYRQARASRKYKHGWEVPRDYAHELQLDIHNATTSGRKLLIWKLSKSKNIKYSKILERLSMTRTPLPMHQRDTRRSEYTLYLMSNTVENSRLDL